MEKEVKEISTEVVKDILEAVVESIFLS